MEWTPARIRLLREAGLCLPQDKFAKDLGFTKRTIGNAERGTHPPSLALRRALEEALESISDTQRTRFLAAVAVEHGGELVSGEVDRQVRYAVGQQHPFVVLDFDPENGAAPVPIAGTASADPG